MVAPLVGAAAIGAVGSLVGGIGVGKAAKKAAKVQQQTAREQMAQAQRFQQQAETRYATDVDRGEKAASIYSGLLGIGDQAAAEAAFNTWRGSTNYQVAQRAALEGVNASASARGMYRSGAAMKALQDRGAGVANGYQQQYMGNLNMTAQTGANAKAALTGAGQQQLISSNSALQNAANASSNAALMQGQYWANAAQNLTRDLQDAYSSSYKKGDKTS